MNIEILIDEVLKMELSLNTKKIYKNCFWKHKTWCALNAVAYEIRTAFSYETIREYKRFLESIYAPSTTSLNLRAIRRLILHFEGKTGERLGARDVRVLNPKFGGFKGIAKNEILPLFDFCLTLNSRDSVMILMQLYCGLRVSEIRDLEFWQVKNDLILDVQGKSKTSRTIPIPARIKSEIERYIKRRNEEHSRAPKTPFFCNDKTEKLNLKTIYTITHNIMTRAKCSRTNPHALRHTYAFMALDHLSKKYGDSKALTMLSKNLGHAFLQTTMSYLTPENEDNKEALDDL